MANGPAPSVCSDDPVDFLPRFEQQGDPGEDLAGPKTVARETLAILARLTPVSTEWTTGVEKLGWGPRRNHGAGRWADCPDLLEQRIWGLQDVVCQVMVRFTV